jgi:DNA polymerase III subunit gamma/tau
MKHTTLYRKWRPRRFSKVVGQEPVVRTLSRAIETGRVAHAYLFSGPRGTGKTSTAKVLAMGLNCAQGPTPEPDGTCESCRAIVNNSSLDVVEMDAASNRGIDEIRDLRDRVNLAPVAGRMKVYIIDEVHMLTAEAFNALLKMLEEPPEHVVFVLATTEKHKVLPTIISRCQSFDFRRPGVETLKEKLAEIAEAENITVEPEALTVIAREGRGSFRDAEGLLDQLSSFAEGPITASMVRELLGSVGPEALLETTAALHERRAADALRIVDRLSNEGRDLGQFVGELISHLRTLMLLPHAPEVALAEVGADERGPLEEQANAIPTAEIVRLIEALDGALGRVKRGGDPKLELELSFLKLTRDYTEPPVENLLRRLEELERAVANGDVSPRRASRPEVAPREDTVDVPADEVEPVEGSELEIRDEPANEAELARTPEDGNGDEREELRGAETPAVPWTRVLQDLKDRRPAVAAVYEGARLEGFDGKVLELSFPEELAIYVKLAGEPKRLDPLREVLEEHLGASPRLEFRVADGASVDVAPLQEEPPPPAAPRAEPAGRRADTPKVRDAGDERPEISGAPSTPEAEGHAPGGDGAGDIIRDQREVFEIARERFGSFEQNRGS